MNEEGPAAFKKSAGVQDCASGLQKTGAFVAYLHKHFSGAAVSLACIYPVLSGQPVLDLTGKMMYIDNGLIYACPGKFPTDMLYQRLSADRWKMWAWRSLDRAAI